MKQVLSFQEINPCIRSAGRDYQNIDTGPHRLIYDYEYIYCHIGSLTVKYTNYSITGSSGQIIIIEPGVIHRLDYTNAQEVYWVHFDFYYLDNQEDITRYIRINNKLALSPSGYNKELSRASVLFKPNYSLPSIYDVSNPQVTKKSFVKLIELFENKKFGWVLEGKQIINSLLIDTIKNLIKVTPKENYIETLIKSIQEYIQENSHRKISKNELSNHFNYHRDTIGRFFKKETGLTIIKYTRKIRHNKAVQLLMESDISLDMIAEQCGYTDRSHLILDFKLFKNTTPTKYKKLYNN